MDINKIEAVLRDMRNQFVDEVPERCLRMEKLVRTISIEGSSGEAFSELYRHVHSMKGSGGTHGLDIITSICHHFENLLTDTTDRNHTDSQELHRRMLAFIDLLATAAETIRRGENLASQEAELERLLSYQEGTQHLVLVADASKTMQGLFRSALAGFNVRIITVTNGMQALARLLHEPVDLFLTGNALHELGGPAVIAALRESGGRNQNIPVVLVKSAGSTMSGHVRADAVVTRNTSMAEQLSTVLSEILGRMDTARNMGHLRPD